MSAVLREIQEWSESVPPWQQEALVRLFENGQLLEDDITDLYALLKAHRGLANPRNIAARRFSPDMLGSAKAAASMTQMVAISNLRHVNALAEGKRLELSPEGLTVIYGGNGSGKSGYARLLKKACRARDVREPILPNADKAVPVDARAAAIFTLRSNGSDTEVEWTDGAASSELLGGFAVFDTRCARSYIDEQGETTYAPYGMDLLRGVAEACDRLNTRLKAEVASVVLSYGPFDHLRGKPTAVGRALQALGASSNPADIEALALLSPEEKGEFESLDAALKEANPRQQAVVARLQAARLTEMAQRVEQAAAPLAPASVQQLEQLVAESKVAKQVADLAAQKFADGGYAPGTGGESWVKLLQAARVFAVEVHPQKPLSALTADDSCPLCQQQLGDAAQRLAAFDDFVEAAAAKASHDSRERAADAYRGVAKSSVLLGLSEADRGELAGWDANLLADLDAFQNALIARQNAIKVAAGDNSWLNVPGLPRSPSQTLRERAQSALQRAKELDALTDEKAIAHARERWNEFSDRHKLHEVKEAVFAYIAATKLQAALTSCELDIRTRPVTTKVGELSAKIVSDQLAQALNEEFKALGVEHLRVVMRHQNSRGQPLFSLALERQGQAKPNAILSEGEQRAIGIAAFMADLRLSGVLSGVIFDDPVSSLDHLRRQRVAIRLVKEAKQRQVIVLTHDVYFLSLLRSEAKLVGVPYGIQSLGRTAEGYGVASPTLPFEGATTRARVQVLRQMHTDIVRFFKEGKNDNAEPLLKTAWMHLRQSWERAVEEVLLNGVVQRFEPGVSTQRLDGVVVEDEDVRAVFEGMTRCNTVPHDNAEIAQVPLPTPDELIQEIERLEAWRSSVVKRTEAIRVKRGLK